MLCLKRVATLFVLLMTTLLFSKSMWHYDFEKACVKAKQEHKNIMLLVVGKHCRWCKKMKYHTLKKREVKEKLGSYVRVSLPYEAYKNFTYLPQIHTVPQLFFMTPNQKILASVRGYCSADALITFIEGMEENLSMKKH